MHRIILPAKQIPVGSTVSKITGSKEFVLANGLTVYRKRRDNEDKSRPSKIEVFSEEDEVMLLAEGYASIEPNDKELVWLATPEEFAEYAHRKDADAAAPF